MSMPLAKQIFAIYGTQGAYSTFVYCRYDGQGKRIVRKTRSASAGGA
jgi:hypothetical protein